MLSESKKTESYEYLYSKNTEGRGKKFFLADKYT